METLFRRLKYYSAIGEEERVALSKMPYRDERFQVGADIVTQGEEPEEAFIVKSGWAARYISLEDGRSQILNFMLPGDMYDLQAFIADQADHSIAALTSVDIMRVRRKDILALFSGPTKAGAAFWWATLQEEAILREQIVRNGRRSAKERIAHLILELHRRAVLVGEGEGNEFRMPISQILLADALGLSFVHVNRVMRSFVNEKYIDRDKSSLVLLDREALVKIADFQETYLHLDASPRQLKFN
ncbi:MAG: Crp/Fnr family transcriptional regulator [Pseudomonadota bacterium]